MKPAFYTLVVIRHTLARVGIAPAHSLVGPNPRRFTAWVRQAGIYREGNVCR
jgi:hypothetical protein